MEPVVSVPALVVTAGARCCALPLAHVSEAMRPLPIESVSGMPAHVLGLSVVRGRAVPVVDLAALLTPGAAQDHGRFVAVLVEDRRFVLAVRSVVGVEHLSLERFEGLPDLLRAPCTEHVDAVGVSGAELMLLLSAARIIPGEVWAKLEQVGAQ